jgi:hypothetical protein
MKIISRLLFLCAMLALAGCCCTTPQGGTADETEYNPNPNVDQGYYNDYYYSVPTVRWL